MTNKEIASWFRRLADIMELHGENPFKIKSYQQAYITLRKWGEPLSELSLEDLNAISGIGKAISEKIRELVETGGLATYRKYTDQTPDGVIDLLDVPGIGPKKVRSLWKDLGVESVGELLYACNENRLIELKGFGVKTQADLIGKLDFYLQTRDQLRYPDAKRLADEMVDRLLTIDPGSRVSLTGELRRDCQIISTISLLWAPTREIDLPVNEGWTRVEQPHPHWIFNVEEGPFIQVWLTQDRHWGRRLWETTGTEEYIRHWPANGEGVTEEAFMKNGGIPVHEPGWRESVGWAEAAANRSGELIDMAAIRGVIHAHSTWSDGLNTLEEMALASQKMGYSYLVITDHSQSAFYANGLKPDRVRAQGLEIAELNQRLAPFRIFHGIESDILYSGELDYTEQELSEFDLIIASIHSQLKMDEGKAMERLIRAIEHPRTRILGHPTGRLLLSRSGYPVDHRRLIDACAEHQVVIELNANPNRLDLDYTWLPYAMDQGVSIAINPDAHSVAGISDIRYGIQMARKAGIRVNNCLNTMELADFEKWVFI